ncbi:MAG: thioesterase family protein [Desulfobacterales bacterium]|nr:thioesterase family protein [Desulfobacterales bacterium]MDJ0991304.1 thioesterase family protein [Desulfobacterales bacterium]
MPPSAGMPPATPEQDWRSTIKDIFENRLPFNRVLGIEVLGLEHGTPRLGLRMREELVGNYMRGSLHGGVISAVIDVTGGLAAFLSLHRNNEACPLDEKIERFGKLGTIDLRVDYLRPGLGSRFESTGHVLRTGHRVAVTRIELKNDQDQLIAVGTGAYVIA